MTVPGHPEAPPADRPTWPRFRAAGDSGLIVEFGDQLDQRINNAALAFDRRLAAAKIAGISETAPTLRSVLVRFDPLTLAPAELRRRLQDLLAEADWLAAGPPEGRSLWRVPLLYGGEAGPDLAEIAERLEVRAEALVAEHAACRQRVMMLGFAPGFAYLGELPERWDLPRLPKVKPSVPPGSLSVAVRQSVLCATTIPTGWRTIARSPFRSFDLSRDPPFQLEPGDEVAFEPVDQAAYDRLQAKAEAGGQVASREQLT
ncbi:MAG: allophanate hydrolase subunit 1 [Pseudomonadota bacterium]